MIYIPEFLTKVLREDSLKDNKDRHLFQEEEDNFFVIHIKINNKNKKDKLFLYF